MSGKKISFAKLRPPVNEDDWVTGSNQSENLAISPILKMSIDPPIMKRFTIDVPVDLHRRIKSQCAMRGEKMANVLRDILEREFPAK